MAGRLAALRRRWPALLAAAAALLLAYFVFLRGSGVEPQLTLLLPTAAIGSGDEAVAVAPDGTVLTWQPPPKDGSLPTLSLSEPPKSGHLAGPALAQVRVLAGAPAALRPYVEHAYFGETGVDVELASGIELRFGDASRVLEKWRTAAAVLADPSIEAPDYVDLHSPRRPAVDGSGNPLPPPP